MTDNELSFLEVMDLVEKIREMLGAAWNVYNELDGSAIWIFGFSNGKPSFALDEKCLRNFYQRLISSTGVKQ